MDYKKLYSDAANSIKASAIRELLKVIARPEVISLAGGLPDPTLFPIEAVAKSMQEYSREDLKTKQSELTDTIENKEYAIENGKKAVEAALKRRNKDSFQSRRC